MPYHMHDSPADPKIKRAMSQGHTLQLSANISKGKQSPDKFNTGGGMKITKDNGANAKRYTARRVASSPMMRPQTAKKSWRSSGSRSRADRSG